MNGGDSGDYVEASKRLAASPMPWPDYYPSSKPYRIKNLFDMFFEGLEFERANDEDGEKGVEFTKNRQLIPIDRLVGW
jgi:hypothetical protein